MKEEAFARGATPMDSSLAPFEQVVTELLRS